MHLNYHSPTVQVFDTNTGIVLSVAVDGYFMLKNIRSTGGIVFKPTALFLIRINCTLFTVSIFFDFFLAVANVLSS